MTPLVGGGLVFFTSGAVLVLEILAARLLAPYVGVTLETYTAIIGTVLAGISAGTWVGGYAADRLEPRRMLGPLLVAGGALSLAVVPIVRVLGEAFDGGGASVVPLTVATFLAPAAVLSAVAPTVVKLQLRSLAVTGRVVGQLSALGTAGAIVGTFVAGFVLVDLVATSTSITAIGVLLMMAGAVLWVRLSSGPSPALIAVVLAGAVAAGAGVATDSPCDTETTYHCAVIVEDESRPSGRSLWLDRAHNSYVDLDDPTYLHFRYIKLFADVMEAEAPPGRLDVLHIGGGGFTMPRYVDAVRPGSGNLVLEIDGKLVDLVRRRLGLVTGPDLQARTGDARTLADDLRPAGYDVVFGDAFSGLTVPWHLTTKEFVETVRARLRPGGVYAINVIDLPPARFAHAEVATLGEVFDHVAVLAPQALLSGDSGGNYVLAGSDDPFDAGRIESLVAARGADEEVLVDDAAIDFADGAPVLTDDHAPVDQWLAQARRS